METPRRLFLVFPLMRGGTLAQYMMKRFSSGDSFSEKEVAVILHQIISAVKFIQENKIVHRDLKPGKFEVIKRIFSLNEWTT
jgi:serine/threonine protein kinase